MLYQIHNSVFVHLRELLRMSFQRPNKFDYFYAKNYTKRLLIY